MARGVATFVVLFWTVLGCGPERANPPPPAAAPGQAPSREACFEHVFPDADGDGWGSGEGMTCTDGFVPDGYGNYAGDCDDADASAFRIYYADADGDGLTGNVETLCAGFDAPAGYQSYFEDCDDTDPTLSQWYALNDLDGDGVTVCAPGAEQVCGSPDERPAGSSLGQGCDCDDSDTSRSWLYFEDGDGDGFAAPGDSVCTGPDAPDGFAPLVFEDCDDTRADVNEFALEEWSDEVDSDCNGYPYPYACEDESCQPQPGPLEVDESCASADLRIALTATPECYSVHYVALIGNQGSEAVPGFTLSIEGWREPIVYAVEDPLPPGAQRSYPISNRFLEGDLTFVLTTGVADCDPDNDAASTSVLPLDCTH